MPPPKNRAPQPRKHSTTAIAVGMPAMEEALVSFMTRSGLGDSWYRYDINLQKRNQVAAPAMRRASLILNGKGPRRQACARFPARRPRAIARARARTHR